MELIEIINILQQEYPNKVIVDLSEYESEEHQTYKYLFEQLSQKYAEKLNEVGMLATDQQNYEKEIAELSQKNASLAAQMESVNQSTINSLGVIKEYVNLGIVVSDIMIRLHEISVFYGGSGGKVYLMVNDTENICAKLAQCLLNAIYQRKNVFFHNKCR